MVKLTRKQKEALEIAKEFGSEGLGVHEYAEARDISHTAAYKILEGAKERRALIAKWAPKGNKKRYYHPDFLEDTE